MKLCNLSFRKAMETGVRLLELVLLSLHAVMAVSRSHGSGEDNT